MVSLLEIEQLLRPNFVWEKTPGRHWYVQTQTSLGIGDQSCIGMIVFCGVAWMNGFKDKEVFHHLDIDRKKHMRFLSTFKQALNDAAATDMNELYANSRPISNRIIAKTRIVQNALKVNFQPKFVNLADINY